MSSLPGQPITRAPLSAARGNADTLSPSSDASLTGRTNNIGLSNFASCSSFSLSDEVKSTLLPKTVKECSRPAATDALHLGFDTVNWSYSLDDTQFTDLLLWCASCVDIRDGDAVIGSLSVGIRRIGGNFCYRITSSFGLAWHVPRELKYPLLILASPEFLLSVPDDQIERDAWCWTAELLNNPSLGEISSQMTLSRVDVALDVKMKEDKFQKLCHTVKNRDSSMITRARDIAPFMSADRDTGFRLGKNAVVLRCYDKTLEAKNSDLEFWAKVWNINDIPSPVRQDTIQNDELLVVRFEYQQRREFLRSFKTETLPDGIQTLEEYRKHAPLILLYLTQAWFRLAGSVRGKENYRVTTAFWQGISDAFVCGRWFSPDDVERVWRDVRRFVSKDDKQLMSMAAGCLASVSAIWAARAGGGAVLELHEVFELLEASIKNSDAGLDGWRDSTIDRLRRIVYNLPR